MLPIITLLIGIEISLNRKPTVPRIANPAAVDIAV
jgi:small basic protein